jgi:aspartyl/asparaginyl beta-hydroxylase (cupin superfamily)
VPSGQQDDARALLRDGLAALQAGRARDAHALLTRATGADPDGSGHYLLAQACRLLGDAQGERAALNRHLHRQPRHLAALLLMAERQAQDGDERAASSFYRTAFAVAEREGDKLTPPLVAMLERGQHYVAQADARFTRHLTDLIDAGMIEDGRATARVRQSLDLLLGRSQLYLQQPSMFYFPGLPQRQFYERDEFPWVAEVEAATATIQAELAAVTTGPEAGFEPYIRRPADRPAPPNHLLEDPSWGAYYLWQSGALVPDHAARCPATVAALARAPMPEIAARSPMGLFSRLTPGTHIRPHHGLLNTRLICHLPLVVPPGCALRVGSETRAWRPGELTIFDDSVEHEAWNRGDSDRVVLLFEVWRPELSDGERASLTRIFEATGLYGADA